MRRFLINVIRSIGYHLDDRDNVRTPITILNDEAIRDSADFIRDRMKEAALFSDTWELRRHVIDCVCAENKPGKKGSEDLILEFGVFKGRTINLFADRLKVHRAPQLIYGFDAFEGLQEDWGQVNYGRGTFDRGGKVPKVRDNVHLVKGWVQDTLPGFLEERGGQKIAFMHMDMDTYTPTKFVLEKTRDRCGSGTVILFDELYGYPKWRDHEHKALGEVYEERDYEYVAFGKLQCAIRLK